MFSSTMDLKPNESGEYEVAKGISASIFRAILVSGKEFTTIPVIALDVSLCMQARFS